MPTPPTQYPVGGKVFDVDGTTALPGATVILQNLTTLEKSETTTESDGSYSFQLANYSQGYTDGDDLLFFVRKVISAKNVKYKIDTDTVSGDALDKSLTVKQYFDKDTYPISVDPKEIKKRVFEPSAIANRVAVIGETSGGVWVPLRVDSSGQLILTA